jgi:hypothetical protein
MGFPSNPMQLIGKFIPLFVHAAKAQTGLGDSFIDAFARKQKE